ncbi:unnamed protein product [Candidula unifasciata]|uniref:Protein PET100 homolog, mitochondrial n=1 Tax=Candidula unifasciata TaxID=100452 RepID=A0A8S3YPM8_9EUPU|nr:unnamed protein product [Candidula unifasciata]
MGSWHLEIFKMAVYIGFPVGLFYCFNQPYFFESWMMEKRAKIFPPTDPEVMKIFDELKRKMELKQEQEWIAAQETRKV